MNSTQYTSLVKILKYIVDKHRYVVIHGDFNTAVRLKYATDILTTEPDTYLKMFELNEENFTIIS